MEKAIRKYWPIFVLPTLLAFIFGFIIPFVEGVYLAFCQFTTVKDAAFIGLSNFTKVFADSTFTHAFWYNCAFVVVSTLVINAGGLAVALILTKAIRGTNAFRTVFFMPNLIGGIVLGYIWQILLNCALSLLEKPLLRLDATAGFWGLVILMAWQQIGYMMIIYIAGLQSIPDRGRRDRRRDALADLLEGQVPDADAEPHDLPLPHHHEQLQALRPEHGPDGRRAEPRLGAFGV